MISVDGVVQGVGFRPFVSLLARELHLAGWVQNTSQGLLIEAEGAHDKLADFLARIESERPATSIIHQIRHQDLDPAGYKDFLIKQSRQDELKSAPIQADLATCPHCIKEIFDSANRRYLYPFTNCTHCGPRFSIMTTVPYDRPNTTMKTFTMCPDCGQEYSNPSDRRFHAQPNACPVCGPKLTLWSPDGKPVSERHAALVQAVEAIKSGAIVAVKGVGGFHLCADATNAETVKALRLRKKRCDKPFALMFSSLAALEETTWLDDIDREMLVSPAAPIVLVRHKEGTPVDKNVAPGNPYWGVMLPYSPLHHILMRELNRPIVATSGNISDEPICTDEYEALYRLKGIADLFLVHDRPIARTMDDSIVRGIDGQKMVLRRSRGYAPLPIRSPLNDNSVLALGGQLKNSVALKIRHNIFTSQHLGDLTHFASQEAFDRAVESFQELYTPKLDVIAHDAHPDYVSTAKAERFEDLAATRVAVQHHHAHIIACMADNGVTEQVLGISWDGTGHGDDNTVWGGEFLLADLRGYTRTATLFAFTLIGGEKAITEPRRTALGALFELSADPYRDFADLPVFRSIVREEYRIFQHMRRNRLHSPLTTSMGRLFDALAAILGLHAHVTFEGQAAMALEHLCDGRKTEEHYPFDIIPVGNGPAMVDWRPVFRTAIADIRAGVEAGTISMKFHNSCIEAALAVAMKAGRSKVALSGGCFQNKYLLERMIRRLRESGLTPLWHHEVPPNDGGLCVGQALGASVL